MNADRNYSSEAAPASVPVPRPRAFHSNSTPANPETHCRSGLNSNHYIRTFPEDMDCSRSFPAQADNSRHFPAETNYSRSFQHADQNRHFSAETNTSRSFQPNPAGPGYYSHSRTVFTEPISEMSRTTGHEGLNVNGLLDDIQYRVSASIAADSLGSSGSSASSARSVISDPSARISSHRQYSPKHAHLPANGFMSDSSARIPPHIGHGVMPDSSARIPPHMAHISTRPASSNTSVCSSRSGFSGLSTASSPKLPTGGKLRCRSLRSGEPLPQTAGWFDMTKGFGGSVNALKKALLSGQMQFLAGSQGYFIRSARKSVERRHDVFYLLWQEQEELSPSQEWSGLRNEINQI